MTRTQLQAHKTSLFNFMHYWYPCPWWVRGCIFTAPFWSIGSNTPAHITCLDISVHYTICQKNIQFKGVTLMPYCLFNWLSTSRYREITTIWRQLIYKSRSGIHRPHHRPSIPSTLKSWTAKAPRDKSSSLLWGTEHITRIFCYHRNLRIAKAALFALFRSQPTTLVIHDYLGSPTRPWFISTVFLMLHFWGS